jgi:hypothetical protein
VLANKRHDPRLNEIRKRGSFPGRTEHHPLLQWVRLQVVRELVEHGEIRSSEFPKYVISRALRDQPSS